MKADLTLYVVVRDYDTLGELVEKTALIETALEDKGRLHHLRKDRDQSKTKVDNHPVEVVVMCGVYGRLHSEVCQKVITKCWTYGFQGHVS